MLRMTPSPTGEGERALAARHASNEMAGRATVARRPFPLGGRGAPLNSLRPAVGARIMRRLDGALGVAHERARVTEEIAARLPFDLVPGLRERPADAVVEPFFQLDAGRGRAPGAAEEIARRVERLA